MCLNYSYLATIINIKSNPIEFLHFICCSAMGSYVKILLLSEKIGMPSKGSQSTSRSSGIQAEVCDQKSHQHNKSQLLIKKQETNKNNQFKVAVSIIIQMQEKRKKIVRFHRYRFFFIFK